MTIRFRAHPIFLAAAVFATTFLITPGQSFACDTSDNIGTICLTAATFCPRNTLKADGRFLDIQQNRELYSLLSTRYGGDGETTFAIPDMRHLIRSNVPIEFCLITGGVYPKAPANQ